jgi:hypothetical protein
MTHRGPSRQPNATALYALLYRGFFKKEGYEMADKGKRDKGKREQQKKGKHTLKEKRKQKKGGDNK